MQGRKSCVEFNKDATKKDGLNSECRECQRSRAREYKRKVSSDRLAKSIAATGFSSTGGPGFDLCPKCGWKPIDQFRPKTGVYRRAFRLCIQCLNANRAPARKKREKERRASGYYRTKWKNRSESARRAHRLSQAQYRKTKPAHVTAKSHKYRAKRNGSIGLFTPQEWDAVCDRYGNKCLRCGASGVKLTVDHIVPLSKGGTNNIDNIQPLCRHCNNRKSVAIADYRPSA